MKIPDPKFSVGDDIKSLRTRSTGEITSKQYTERDGWEYRVLWDSGRSSVWPEHTEAFTLLVN